jgi:NADH:ubiquinone oxidoreductase subunit 4 (subunit M)
MLITILPTVPLLGVVAIYSDTSYMSGYLRLKHIKKKIALAIASFSLFIAFIVFILFDASFNQFQFVLDNNITNYSDLSDINSSDFIKFGADDTQCDLVQDYSKTTSFSFYFGLDGLSIYFVLLTAMIAPIALLSN